MNENEQEQIKTLPWFGIPKLIPYVKPYRKKIILMVSLGVLSSVADAVFPLFNRYALDHFVAEKTLQGLGFFCVLFVVLEMAISDQLYRVVPDQFSIFLAVMAIAFAGYYDNWWEPLAGAGLGLAISLAILGLGMLLFRTGSIGGADIKFFTCMGLIAGRQGIVIIYILTTLFFAVLSVVRIASGKGSLRDSNPMMPPACAAVTVYFLFLWNLEDLIFSL